MGTLCACSMLGVVQSCGKFSAMQSERHRPELWLSSRAVAASERRTAYHKRGEVEDEVAMAA